MTFNRTAADSFSSTAQLSNRGTRDLDWPAPLGEAAYHGVLGRIVRAIDPTTEADPAAVLLQLLVALGNLIGRSAHIPVGADTHRTNLFLAVVGGTGRGRKGTAWSAVARVLDAVDPSWRNRCVGGISTGQGIVAAVKDDPGAPQPQDQRLLIVELELARLLVEATRGRLSADLRDAWDGSPLQVVNRTDPIKASDPHISIVGHITPKELRHELAAVQVANGFANRFLFCATRRSKSLPHPPPFPDLKDEVDALQFTLQTSVPSLLSPVDLATQEAKDRWSEIYSDLDDREDDESLTGELTARGKPLVLRLALVYAVLANSRIIEPEHLDAALAVWQYSLGTVGHLFGKKLGHRDGDRLLTAIRATGGMTRREINDLFAGNRTRDQIEEMLALLKGAGTVRAEREKTGGRPVERWFPA